MEMLINKSECKYRTKFCGGFAQIMGLFLYICNNRKVFFSKVCIKPQCNRICFSGSRQYSRKNVTFQTTWKFNFFLFKNLPRAVISLSVFWNCKLLYINNVFSFLTEQYFIDALETILKLFQGFWNTLLNPKMFFLSCSYFGLIFG